jgi:hypothetical protein
MWPPEVMDRLQIDTSGSSVRLALADFNKSRLILQDVLK